MHNVVLLLIAISLVGCEKLPPSPDVWRCTLLNPAEFFCVNSGTEEERTLLTSDPIMSRSQCLSLPDYGNMQDWISEIKAIAERKCKK